MTSPDKFLVGVDIGGTKISVCVGDAAGNIRAAQRFPIAEVASSYPAGLSRIVEVTKAVLDQADLTMQDVASVGIAAPSPMDNRRGLLLAPTNIKGWGIAPIVADLAKQLDKPVRMFNDANACALAEFRFGCGRDIKNLIYLTNSTGMGGGLIINGQVLEGADDTAGEVGHCVLDPNGPPCPCGLNGCFEAYCGGRNMAQRIQERILAGGIQTRILDHAGGKIDQIAMPALLAAVRENDAFAIEVWDEYVLRMAQGIGILIMTLNPELVILGTIAIHAGDLFMDPWLKLLPKFAWSAPLKTCRIAVSSLGASIGDYSALAVAMG